MSKMRLNISSFLVTVCLMALLEPRRDIWYINIYWPMTSICLVAILDPRRKAVTYLTNICGMAMSESQLIFPNLLAIICWVIIYFTIMSQYLIFVRCSRTSQRCLPTFSVFMVFCFRPFLLKKIVFPLMPSSPFIQILHLLVFSL